VNNGQTRCAKVLREISSISSVKVVQVGPVLRRALESAVEYGTNLQFGRPHSLPVRPGRAPTRISSGGSDGPSTEHAGQNRPLQSRPDQRSHTRKPRCSTGIRTTTELAPDGSGEILRLLHQQRLARWGPGGDEGLARGIAELETELGRAWRHDNQRAQTLHRGPADGAQSQRRTRCGTTPWALCGDCIWHSLEQPQSSTTVPRFESGHHQTKKSHRRNDSDLTVRLGKTFTQLVLLNAPCCTVLGCRGQRLELPQFQRQQYRGTLYAYARYRRIDCCWPKRFWRLESSAIRLAGHPMASTSWLETTCHWQNNLRGRSQKLCCLARRQTPADWPASFNQFGAQRSAPYQTFAAEKITCVRLFMSCGRHDGRGLIHISEQRAGQAQKSVIPGSWNQKTLPTPPLCSDVEQTRRKPAPDQLRPGVVALIANRLAELMEARASNQLAYSRTGASLLNTGRAREHKLRCGPHTDTSPYGALSLPLRSNAPCLRVRAERCVFQPWVPTQMLCRFPPRPTATPDASAPTA
jgi:hypothetical protein